MAYTLSTLRLVANNSIHCVNGCDKDAHLQHSFGNDFVVSPIVAAAPTFPPPPPSPPPPAPPVSPKACNASTAGNGLDTTAPPIMPPVATPNADACAAACCANDKCSAYTFDPKQDDASGMPVCHVGKPCCWLKYGSGTTVHGRSRLNSAHFGAPRPPPPPPAPSTGQTEWPMWVPPGKWVEWFGGIIHTGPEHFVRNYSATEIPLLVKAGAIIPMKGMEAVHSIAPEQLILEAIWVDGTNGTSSVYEDAGDSLDYQTGAYVLTDLSLNVGSTQTTLVVRSGKGQSAESIGLPAQRRYEVRFRGAPSGATSWMFEPEAAAIGSSWWWEDSVGGKTLVGVTAMVTSNMTVSATFNHV